MSEVSKSTAAFLDTSIQIARLIHSPETCRQIDERLQSFDLTTTGLVVRQEFKRRLLKDARYLLDLFLRHQSFARVHRHIVDVLTPFQRRKQRISLQLLSTLIEDDSDADRTERAILLLRGLLRECWDPDFLYDEWQGEPISLSRAQPESRCETRQPVQD